MFDAISSSVSEGDTTSGICLSVTATSLSCNITITLTTNPGTAGIPFIYAIIIHIKSIYVNFFKSQMKVTLTTENTQ